MAEAGREASLERPSLERTVKELVSRHRLFIESLSSEIRKSLTNQARSDFVQLCLFYIEWREKVEPVAKSLFPCDSLKEKYDVYEALVHFPAVYDLIEFDPGWIMCRQEFGRIVFALHKGTRHKDLEIRKACAELLTTLGERLSAPSPVLQSIRECSSWHGDIGTFYQQYQRLLTRCRQVAKRTPIPRGKSADHAAVEHARKARFREYQKEFPEHHTLVTKLPRCYEPEEMALRLLSRGKVGDTRMRQERARTRAILRMYKRIMRPLTAGMDFAAPEKARKSK